MLKVKVEPVEPTLYGKVFLPNNPLTIAGYQVFCSDEEQNDKVTKLDDHIETDPLVSDSGTAEDVGIDGADRMMTDCCGENELMVGDMGEDHSVKEDQEDLHIGEYVENDVMVDNNIVEEQVVEDSMVLISPVAHEAHDKIQVPYMETGPTEVLVIEEGAELMVENIHGMPHVIMGEENRECLITSDVPDIEESDGQPKGLITNSDQQEIIQEQPIIFDHPEHVVERINYDVPLIPPSDTPEYFLQDDQASDTADSDEAKTDAPAKESMLEIKKTQKLKKIVRRESNLTDTLDKNKKEVKRKPEWLNIADYGEIQSHVEKNLSKPCKRQKSWTPVMKCKKLSTPEDKVPVENKQSEKLSPIQANHPTLSLLLSKTGPMELFGPAVPVTTVKKQLFMSQAAKCTASISRAKVSTTSLSMTKPTVRSVSSTSEPPAIPKPKTVPNTAMPETVLPQIITDVNEEREDIFPSFQMLPVKKSSQKLGKASTNIKHSKSSNKPGSVTIAVKDLSTYIGTPSSIHTLGKTESAEALNKSTGQLAKIVQTKTFYTQAAVSSVSVRTPISVAVADTIAVANLPAVKPAATLQTLPKPVVAPPTESTPPSTFKNLPVIVKPAVDTQHKKSPPVTAPLHIPVTSPSEADICKDPVICTDRVAVVSPIQQKYQVVNTTLQAKSTAKTGTTLNGSETLADRYMKEWKPTGRFQCKLCLYSCVTHNFLFRHWVLNHCSLRPYMCGHCGFQSATRDGITRHQTAKHRSLARRIFIDNEQQELLWNKFDEMFQGSGFVTEIERQAQASYTLGHAQEFSCQDRRYCLYLPTSTKGRIAVSRDKEVTNSTILKVPNRDKVPSNFREIISEEDDQDVGSQDSGEEELEAINKFYQEYTPTNNSAHQSESQLLEPGEILPSDHRTVHMKDIVIKKEDSVIEQSQELVPTGIIQKQVNPKEVDKIYQLITSGTAIDKTELTAQGKIKSTTLITAASKEYSVAQPISNQVITSSAEPP